MEQKGELADSAQAEVMALNLTFSRLGERRFRIQSKKIRDS
jgi:hypothetical protein